MPYKPLDCQKSQRWLISVAGMSTECSVRSQQHRCRWLRESREGNAQSMASAVWEGTENGFFSLWFRMATELVSQQSRGFPFHPVYSHCSASKVHWELKGAVAEPGLLGRKSWAGLSSLRDISLELIRMSTLLSLGL